MDGDPKLRERRNVLPDAQSRRRQRRTAGKRGDPQRMAGDRRIDWHARGLQALALS
jgi:hypothetical protein